LRSVRNWCAISACH